MVNLSKICVASVLGSVFGYLRIFCTMTEIFSPFFFSLKGMHCLLWVSSKLEGGAFRLVRCTLNLRVVFNKIISEVQGREAPPTDLELTHYQQRVPRRKKNGESNLGIISSRKTNFRFFKTKDNYKTEGLVFFFDRLNDPKTSIISSVTTTSTKCSLF